MIKFIKQFFISSIIFFLLLIAADLVVGNKMNKIYQGWNYEGYRGELKKGKEDNTRRIAFFGSSALMGWGLKYNQSIPFLFEEKVKKFGFDVVNLGLQGNGISGVYSDIRNYRYLKYDTAIIYSGFTDCNLLYETKQSRRGNSLLFKYFTYLPSLDVYIIDKFESVTGINLRKRLKRKDEKWCFDDKIKKSEIDIEKFEIKLDKYFIKYYGDTINYLMNNEIDVYAIIPPNTENILFNIQKRKLKKFLKNYSKLKVIDLSEINLGNSYYLYNKGVHLNINGTKKLSELIFESFNTE